MSDGSQDRAVLIAESEGGERARLRNPARRRLLVGAIATVAAFIVAFTIGFTIFKVNERGAELAAPIQSQSDPSHYEVITLNNGLRAVIVSDPYAASSLAVAMRVDVGSAANPNRTDGVAHLLEHMLFLGTRKYPTEDEFHELVTAMGGFANAYTAFMETVYYFEAMASDMDDVSVLLDHFAAFFVAPLLDRRAMGREIQAVSSENSKNINQDVWRQNQLMRDLMINPAHPYNRFNTGNEMTLNGSHVYDDLVALHSTFYIAPSMTLAVISSRPTSAIGGVVRRWFTSVPSEPTPPPAAAHSITRAALEDVLRTTPLVKAQQPLVVEWRPVVAADSYKMCWRWPSLAGMGRTKSYAVMTTVLARKGAGSLHHHLSSQDFIHGSDGIEVDIADSRDRYNSIVCVTTLLTVKGFESRDDVGIAILQYLSMVRDAPRDSLKAVWDVSAEMGELNWSHPQQPLKWSSWAQSLARDLPWYGTRELLRGDSSYESFDEAEIRSLAAMCTAKNSFVMVGSARLDGLDETEEWYGVKYSLKPLAAAFIKRAELAAGAVAASSMALPSRSRWIPTHLTPLACPSFKPKLPPRLATAHPSIALDTDKMRVWFKPDDSFCQPRGVVNIDLISPRINRDALSFVNAQVALDLVGARVAELMDDAASAGMAAVLSLGGGGLFPSTGLRIEVSGYSTLLIAYVIELVDKLRTAKFQQQAVTLAETRIRDTLDQARHAQPWIQAKESLEEMLESGSRSSSDQLKAIGQQNGSATSLQSFWEDVFAELKAEILIFGNFERETAVAALRHGLNQKLHFAPLPKSHLPRFHLNLPERGLQDVLLKSTEDDDNSVVLGAFQVGDNDDERNPALANTLAAMISPPLYASLRTKQQLGYVVFASVMRTYNVFYLYIVVQSNVAGPAKIQASIDEFLNETRHAIAKYDDRRFNSLTTHLAASAGASPINTAAEAAAHWAEILRREYVWHRDIKYMNTLKNLTIADIRDAYEMCVAPSKRRRFVSVISYGARQTFPSNATHSALVRQLTTVAQYHAIATPSAAYPRFNFSS